MKDYKSPIPTDVDRQCKDCKHFRHSDDLVQWRINWCGLNEKGDDYEGVASEGTCADWTAN